MVKDLASGTGSSLLRSLVSFAGKLFFVTWTANEGAEWWTSDGTTAGTQPFQPIHLPSRSPISGKLSSSKRRRKRISR